jgi:glycosyltransferase involved in cell wall biosynthesis
MKAAPLQLSIVMATYNRARTLARTLGHLAKQDLDGDLFELVVVDDASPDATPTVVADLAPSLPFAVRFLRNQENRGPGFTQNRGIREARAPVLLIMTDDVFMTPGAIRAHLEFHREHPEDEWAALGKVVQSPELNGSALMRNWDPFRFWLLEGADELPYYMFWACNVSCKLDFMRRHGMFREHRGRGGPVAFEDLEVGYRLSGQGLRLRYVAAAVGYHHHEYNLDQARQRWYERGLNYHEFRRYVPDPLLTVYFHVLDRRTAAEYARVLRGPNPYRGWERSFAWHLVRHVVRMVLLNRLTVPLLWQPLLRGAEKSRLLERLVSRQTYRAFFYYCFLRGIHDAGRRFGTRAEPLRPRGFGDLDDRAGTGL